jgi:hypothetical protein
MWEDPVVAEVHRAREKIAASYNFDIAAFFADLRKRQASLGSRLIPQKPPNKTLQPISASPGSTSAEAAPAAEF